MADYDKLAGGQDGKSYAQRIYEMSSPQMPDTPLTATMLRQLEEHAQAKALAHAHAQAQVQAHQPTAHQVDRLNDSIDRLCHLLETLQLSVIGKRDD
tara:strand:+ start:774 stop:1064 length:291 start_codon:yes stop_codon:yes gene_type:complete